MRRASIDDLLSIRDEFDMCEAIYRRMVGAMDAARAEPSREQERTIVLTWDAGGVIGNGGFKYLFEGMFFDRDPGYAHTLQGFAAIGAEGSRQAFAMALAWFPSAVVPAEAEERLRIYESVPEAERDRINALFWRSKGDYFRQLAKYIRANKLAIEGILADYATRKRR